MIYLLYIALFVVGVFLLYCMMESAAKNGAKAALREYNEESEKE